VKERVKYMIPDWAEKYLDEMTEAEYDSRSGEPISWGRKIISEMPEDMFTSFREICEVICVYPDWFVIEKRIQFSDLLMRNGPVRAVGLGPSGGFKWVKFDNGSIWGHSSFKSGVLKQVESNPRLIVKCDKDGNEKGESARVPRVAIGRSLGKGPKR
jgi:hypothetical protein